MTRTDIIDNILASSKLTDEEKLRQMWRTCTKEEKETIKNLHYGLYYTLLAIIYK